MPPPRTPWRARHQARLDVLERVRAAQRRFGDERIVGDYAWAFARVRALALYVEVLDAHLAALTPSDEPELAALDDAVREMMRDVRDALAVEHDTGVLALGAVPRVEPTAPQLEALRSSMLDLCDLAGRDARYIEEHVDRLSARLAAIDRAWEEREAVRRALP